MLWETPFITGYSIVVVTLLGLVMGSFLNCMAWRITHGESVLSGRSHCTTCGHVLAARDLVPVFSWLLSRGKCRYCGERVSARYPATEVACAVLYVSLLLRYNISLEFVELAALASVLLVITLTDLDEYIIPNSCIVVALLIRLAYIAVTAVLGQGALALVLLRESVIGAFALLVPMLALVLVMDRVLGRESMGGGDLKLFAVVGAFVGWQQGILVVVLSCVLGIAFSALFSKGSDDPDVPERAFPFGPAIAVACWICLLVGEQAVGWYLTLFLG